MHKKNGKRNFKAIAKKNRLKADFSKEVGDKRKCAYCKSYMKYSDECALGNKVDSKYICYRFTIRSGMEDQYKKYLLSIKNGK